MRLSVRENDPGYSPRAYAARPYLDGMLLDNCFTADEELGEAHCYAKDANGGYILDGMREALVEEVLYGVVRIEVPPDTLHVKLPKGLLCT